MTTNTFVNNAQNSAIVSLARKGQTFELNGEKDTLKVSLVARSNNDVRYVFALQNDVVRKVSDTIAAQNVSADEYLLFTFTRVIVGKLDAVKNGVFAYFNTDTLKARVSVNVWVRRNIETGKFELAHNTASYVRMSENGDITHTIDTKDAASMIGLPDGDLARYAFKAAKKAEKENAQAENK